MRSLPGFGIKNQDKSDSTPHVFNVARIHTGGSLQKSRMESFALYSLSILIFTKSTRFGFVSSRVATVSSNNVPVYPLQVVAKVYYSELNTIIHPLSFLLTTTRRF